MFSVNVLWSSYEKTPHYFNVKYKVYLLMFIGKVIVKFLLCCIIANGLEILLAVRLYLLSSPTAAVCSSSLGCLCADLGLN